MEVKFALLIIFGVTFVICMAAIFAGCNEAFSNEDNGISSEKICEGYSTVRTTTASPFEKCIIKQQSRENTCSDYFWWLRY